MKVILILTPLALLESIYFSPSPLPKLIHFLSLLIYIQRLITVLHSIHVPFQSTLHMNFRVVILIKYIESCYSSASVAFLS